jgi:hypothetical protein
VKLDLILIEMFKKKNRVLIAAILTLTLGIPISAISMGVKASTWSPLVSEAELTISGIGKAEWTSSVAHSDDWSILLEAPGQATWNSTLGLGEDVNEGRIVIKLAPGTTLGDIESLSWWVNTTTGYPPHADLLLDLDGDGVFDGGKKDMVTGETLSGDDDILVAEFAYQPYTGPGYEYVNQPGSPYGHYDPALQGSHYNPSYDVWVQTFQNETSETGTLELYNETVCWLYRGLPGPFNGSYFGKLEDFKEESVQIIGGTEFAPVNSSVAVLEIHIEMDNWLGAAKAYVDDIAINGEPILGELMAPAVEIISPEHKTYASGDVPVEIEALDIFGVDAIWYNVKKDGSWIFGENQTYTGIASLSSLSDGDYRLYAWANNTLGLVGKASVEFHVRTSLTVEICPKTLNLKSNGKWVTVYIMLPEDISADDVDVKSLELEVGDESISANWTRAGEGVLMVKFSRGALKGIVDGLGEVEIQVYGKLVGGGSFGGSDTIKVINPGKGGPGPHGNQNGWTHREQNHNGTFNGENPVEGDQAKPNKGGKNK